MSIQKQLQPDIQTLDQGDVARWDDRKSTGLLDKFAHLPRRVRVLSVAGLLLAATFVPTIGAGHAQARELISDSLTLSEATANAAPAFVRQGPSSRGGSRTDAPAAPNTSVTPPEVFKAPVIVAPAPAATPTPDISTPDKFIAALVPPAQESQRATGVPASVTIAQAILESEWGKSGLSTEAQNYFGIKAADGPGPAGQISMDTWEVFGGKNTVIDDAFKAYHNLYESVMDHGNFLRDNPRYADAFKTSDPKQFAQRIHKDGYATDPDYCGKVGNLIDKYGLTKYDVTGGAGSPANSNRPSGPHS